MLLETRASESKASALFFSRRSVGRDATELTPETNVFSTQTRVPLFCNLNTARRT